MSNTERHDSSMKFPLNDGRNAEIHVYEAFGNNGFSWSLWDDTTSGVEDGHEYFFTHLGGGSCVNDEDGAAQAMGWLNGKGLL